MKSRGEVAHLIALGLVSMMLCYVTVRTVASIALFNPETSILTQKRHPYTGNSNSDTSGDSKNACLRCGDVLGHIERLRTDCSGETRLDLHVPSAS